jgi:hypothetical protein
LPEKEKAAEQALARFKYRSNVLARILPTGVNDTIGVLMQPCAVRFTRSGRDLVEAMTLGEKIVVFINGRKEQIGAPLDLYDGRRLLRSRISPFAADVDAARHARAV